MLQIQAKRDSRTSREGNDSWLCVVLHQEPSPTVAEGNRMKTANQRFCSPPCSRPGKLLDEPKETGIADGFGGLDLLHLAAKVAQRPSRG